MTPKERVIRAINHREVDRVPFDYLGAPKEINEKLCQHLGVKTYEEMLQYFEIDVRRYNSSGGYIGPTPIQIDRDTTEDARGCIYKATIDSTGQRVSTLSRPPLSDAKTVDEILNYKRYPSVGWYNYMVPEEAKSNFKDYASVLYDAGILFLHAMDLRGMENIMIDMAVNPDMAHALFNKISEFNLERTRRYLEANPGLFDIVGIGDDVAGQDGLFFSLSMWREYIKPHLKKMVDLCNEYEVVPYFHGCGGFSELFPDFIEMGIKAVGKLQPHAKGNNLRRLKSEFGGEICLWGGIDVQHIVPLGTPEEVKKHIEEIIDVGSPGSGFIASPAHNYTAGTPIENIITVYETLKDKSVR